MSEDAVTLIGECYQSRLPNYLEKLIVDLKAELKESLTAYDLTVVILFGLMAETGFTPLEVEDVVTGPRSPYGSSYDSQKLRAIQKMPKNWRAPNGTTYSMQFSLNPCHDSVCQFLAKKIESTSAENVVDDNLIVNLFVNCSTSAKVINIQPSRYVASKDADIPEMFEKLGELSLLFKNLVHPLRNTILEEHGRLNASLMGIPTEMKLKIFECLKIPEEWKALSETCIDLHILGNDQELWKSYLMRDFGSLPNHKGSLEELWQCPSSQVIDWKTQYIARYVTLRSRNTATKWKRWMCSAACHNHYGTVRMRTRIRPPFTFNLGLACFHPYLYTPEITNKTVQLKRRQSLKILYKTKPSNYYGLGFLLENSLKTSVPSLESIFGDKDGVRRRGSKDCDEEAEIGSFFFETFDDKYEPYQPICETPESFKGPIEVENDSSVPSTSGTRSNKVNIFGPIASCAPRDLKRAKAYTNLPESRSADETAGFSYEKSTGFEAVLSGRGALKDSSASTSLTKESKDIRDRPEPKARERVTIFNSVAKDNDSGSVNKIERDDTRFMHKSEMAEKLEMLHVRVAISKSEPSEVIVKTVDSNGKSVVSVSVRKVQGTKSSAVVSSKLEETVGLCDCKAMPDVAATVKETRPKNTKGLFPNITRFCSPFEKELLRMFSSTEIVNFQKSAEFAKELGASSGDLQLRRVQSCSQLKNYRSQNVIKDNCTDNATPVSQETENLGLEGTSRGGEFANTGDFEKRVSEVTQETVNLDQELPIGDIPHSSAEISGDPIGYEREDIDADAASLLNNVGSLPNLVEVSRESERNGDGDADYAEGVVPSEYTYKEVRLGEPYV